jgi:hypothetical protein
MPLYIKDDKVAEMARDLAKRKHCTVTDVVRLALEREARDVEADRDARWEEIRAIQKRVAADWQGPRTSNHDFLYDENGDPIL